MLELKLAMIHDLFPPVDGGDSADPSGPFPARLRPALRMLKSLAAQPSADQDVEARVEWLRGCEKELEALLPRMMAMAHAEALSSEPTARMAARLARQLALHVHDGFKRQARERSRESGFLRARRAAEALALALASAWRLLCVHVRLYTPVPAGFWSDCHALFAYARAHGWEGRCGGADESLGRVYRKLLLLGMTGANRLEPEKIELLIELVEREAAGLELSPAQAWNADENEERGGFVFDAETDFPPRFLDDGAVAASSQRGWVVDVRGVVEELGRRLAALQGADRPDAQERQLLMRLRQDWGEPRRRRHARRRRADDAEVELVSTLAACWATACADGGKPGAARWQLPLEEGEGAETAVERPARLRIQNSSASGMLLRGEAGSHLLRTGELVMVRRPGRWWRLGLVRWVAFPGDDAEIQCGIEVVGPAPEAVLLTPVISHTGGGYRRALSLRRGRILVVAGRLFQPERAMLVSGGGEAASVRATRLVLQSARHQVMEVRR